MRFLHAAALSKPRRAASSRLREMMCVHTFPVYCSSSAIAFSSDTPSLSPSSPWEPRRSARGRVAMYFIYCSDRQSASQLDSSASVINAEAAALVGLVWKLSYS